MILVDKDVTKVTPQTAFIAGDFFVSNSDGSVSIALDAAGTNFAGREPFTTNIRHDGAIGAYQKFTKQGNLLISQMTVPDGRTDIEVYTWAEGKSF